jgi:REP element-mobilizing transposase RayT
MARPLRIDYPGAIYHITCRGNERRAIVADDADRIAFQQRLARCVETYQLRLHGYVLMDNHFHLMVESPLGNVSPAMRQFNVAYTGYYNRRHQRSGHLYQGRFKAIVVEADAYLLELSRYIHLNPIRVGRARSMTTEEQVRNLRDYGWSSLRGYLRTRDREKWITYDRVLAYTGGDTSGGRAAYARYVEEGMTKGVPRPWDKVVGGVLLGGETFVASMQRRFRMIRDRERPAVRAVAQVVLPEVISKRIEALLRGEGLRDTTIGRGLLTECLYRYGQMTQSDIGRHVGGIGYSRVSQLRRAFREAAEADRHVRELFVRAQQVIAKD